MKKIATPQAAFVSQATFGKYCPKVLAGVFLGEMERALRGQSNTLWSNGNTRMRAPDASLRYVGSCCGLISCSSGSTCPIRGSKTNFTRLPGCAGSLASTLARIRCRTKRPCCASAVCRKARPVLRVPETVNECPENTVRSNADVEGSERTGRTTRDSGR